MKLKQIPYVIFDFHTFGTFVQYPLSSIYYINEINIGNCQIVVYYIDAK